ncbi:tyrosine-type recombinase/integrase [Pseudooceanicola sp.]|uniref:tyrosine-type recombinase/integrase n=1 Tax=Pseudooceanicola sp. TaxID=1914328 RepID=UPI003517627C
MAADIRLDKHVQAKIARGRTYYYFRAVRQDRTEFRRRLPHPFDDGYRAAYSAAFAEFYGHPPIDFSDPFSFEALINRHRQHRKYKDLSKPSRLLRDLACDLILSEIGQFPPMAIRPIHVQAIYDKLSDRPATANRRLDDMSALFAFGLTRGFVDRNPCQGVERVQGGNSYEPWPLWALERLVTEGQPHIVKPALVAIYTGQRRGDCLTKLCEAQIVDGVWMLRQGKTKNDVPVPLHPIVLAIVEEHRKWMRSQNKIDPTVPVLRTSRNKPWSGGFGASWAKEMMRLKLHAVEPSLTFHGLRTTNATLIASAVAKSPDLYGGIERVKAMLGHLSKRMAEHYARHAIAEQINTDSVLLLPDFGKHAGEIGKH